MFARLLVVAASAALAWGVVARGSGGTGRDAVYLVRPSDTLWSIAASHYGGDPREGLWKLQRRNHLTGTLLRPGQRLVLP